MSDPLSRRQFIAATGAAAAASTLAGPLAAATKPGAPALHLNAGKTAVVSSANGIRGVKKAYDLIEGGADTLDAGIEGVKIQELDPTDMSVGYGGLPNEDGVVQLDASCMHGPSKRAGAVAALEGIKTPSEIARLVMKYTDHILLVGEGAKKFALSFGYQEEDLLTPESRAAWLRWRANRGHADDWIDVPDSEQMVHRPTGTINMNMVNAQGDVSSVTTTSGLAFKIAGRAGDSPIVGAGEYTDNTIGAAGSTGLGELNIMVCGGFLTVEHMRRGMKPVDACMETLKRVLTQTPPKLIDPSGKPKFGLTYYAITKKGEFGSASFYPAQYAGCDERGAALYDCAHMFDKQP